MVTVNWLAVMLVGVSVTGGFAWYETTTTVPGSGVVLTLVGEMKPEPFIVIGAIAGG